VLLAEDYRSINDAVFAAGMTGNRLIDAPASYHGGACGFPVGDGYSEIHKWKDGRTIVKGNNFSSTTFTSPNVDLIWLQQHTSVSIR